MFNLENLFRIRGGVHPKGYKQSTTDKSIDLNFPLPEQLYIPLQQHIGKPAKPSVVVGEKVLKGQLLANSQGMISAPVHAPTSGVIADITDFPAAHPSALPVRTIILQADGEDRWIDTTPTEDPFELEPEEVSLRVGSSGVVGLGGATFPSAVKLNLGRQNNIHTLLINGGECEPYLTCDDRLMQERAEQIIDGVRIMLHGMRTKKAIIAIEDNKHVAFTRMLSASRKHDEVEVIQVPTHYPMGWDRALIRYITGKEVPADGRATDVGVLMHNVATAYSIHQAIRDSRPLVSRIVTVSGGAVESPVNIETPIGTLLSRLLEYCGYDPTITERIVMGGPMMGDALPHADLPVVKATSGILALSKKEVRSKPPQPCIRCSACVSACPVGLLPLEMAGRIRSNQLDSAIEYGLTDCISCGSCSYVCPSNIPLVHYFKYAKGELVSRQQAQHKAEQTKRLVDDRQARLDRIKQEKAAEAARRKAEKEKRKKEKEAQAKKEESIA